MPANALHCPTCGAAASAADPRSCTYCGTRLAAVQCARCFGTMFHASKYCPHCGAAGAQKRATDFEKLFCPRCKSARRKPLMEPSELHGIHLDECGSCGGVWIDHATFGRICESAESQADALNMLGAARGSTERRVRYVRCPLCDQQMARRNYARRSGVIVDFCPSHGLWFDHDELRHVVEFIRTGGLDEARRADTERIAAEAERRRLTELLDRRSEPETFPDGGVASPTGQEVSGMLDLLFRTLRR